MPGARQPVLRLEGIAAEGRNADGYTHFRLQTDARTEVSGDTSFVVATSLESSSSCIGLSDVINFPLVSARLRQTQQLLQNSVPQNPRSLTTARPYSFVFHCLSSGLRTASLRELAINTLHAHYPQYVFILKLLTVDTSTCTGSGKTHITSWTQYCFSAMPRTGLRCQLHRAALAGRRHGLPSAAGRAAAAAAFSKRHLQVFSVLWHAVLALVRLLCPVSKCPAGAVWSHI